MTGTLTSPLPASRVLDANAVAALSQGLRGRVLTADTPGYDDARTIWNAMIDKRPAGIARGASAAHGKRAVPFPSVLSEPLARLCEGKSPDDLVFADRFGRFLRRPKTSAGTSSWFLDALTTAGIERLTPHDLRHTAASLAVSSGANVKAVQRMLGHKSAAMTLDTYADLFEDDLDAVAERIDERARAAHIENVWPTS